MLPLDLMHVRRNTEMVGKEFYNYFHLKATNVHDNDKLSHHKIFPNIVG